ncbi:MAG: putative metal dependent phosphohydrolase domain protein [Firmicutes bacterium]|nr:putative metal dependent phosphohydrolase domain protein [Bacillota bacterium]
MLRLATSQLQPGMIIARNIFSATGKLLLSENVILDEPLISKLGTLGIDSVFVNHPHLEITPQEMVNEETRVEIIKMVSQAFGDIRENRTFNLTGICEAMKKIIEDAIGNRHVLIQMTDIRASADYTFGHSINVCLLSIMIGIKMNLNHQQLLELAMGAILHDLGMLLVPTEIVQKTDAISPTDWQRIQTHTKKGFEIIRRVGPIPLVSAHVAFQHHESFDGTGYCRGLVGENIHIYARIVAVADLYDAITSDRPYRKAFLPHEAYDIMLASRGAKLDPKIVDIFLENVVIYPVGTTVLLDTGEIGVVVEIHPQLQVRPVVRIIIDQFGNPWQGPEKKVDFTKDLIRFIVKVLKPEEIFALRTKCF